MIALIGFRKFTERIILAIPLNGIELRFADLDVCLQNLRLISPVLIPDRKAVEFSALSGFVIMLHSYYDFSPGVTFSKIPESFSNFT